MDRESIFRKIRKTASVGAIGLGSLGIANGIHESIADDLSDGASTTLYSSVIVMVGGSGLMREKLKQNSLAYLRSKEEKNQELEELLNEIHRVQNPAEPLPDPNILEGEFRIIESSTTQTPNN